MNVDLQIITYPGQSMSTAHYDPKVISSLLSSVSDIVNQLLVHLECVYNQNGIICLIQNELIKNRVMAIISPINFMPYTMLHDVMCLHEDKSIPLQPKAEEEAEQEMSEEDERDLFPNEREMMGREKEKEKNLLAILKQDTSESEPEDDDDFAGYLRRQVLKVSKKRNWKSRKKQVRFGGEEKKTKISDYAQFAMILFKFINERKLKVGSKSSIIISEMWSKVQRMGIKKEQYHELFASEIKKYIKSVYQGLQD